MSIMHATIATSNSKCYVIRSYRMLLIWISSLPDQIIMLMSLEDKTVRQGVLLVKLQYNVKNNIDLH